jgi:hypothetical protein
MRTANLAGHIFPVLPVVMPSSTRGMTYIFAAALRLVGKTAARPNPPAESQHAQADFGCRFH